MVRLADPEAGPKTKENPADLASAEPPRRNLIAIALGEERMPKPIEIETFKSGWTYFVQASCGAIKIGRARNVGYRLRELQCANPRPLTLLAVAVNGNRETEFHRRFAEHRFSGEWFNPHPDILAEVDRLSPPCAM